MLEQLSKTYTALQAALTPKSHDALEERKLSLECIQPALFLSLRMPASPPTKNQAPSNQKRGYVKVVYRGPERSTAVLPGPMNGSKKKSPKHFSKKFRNNNNRNTKPPIPVRSQEYDEWIHLGLCDESIDASSLPPLKSRGIILQQRNKKSHKIPEERQVDIHVSALPSSGDAQRNPETITCEEDGDSKHLKSATNKTRDSDVPTIDIGDTASESKNAKVQDFASVDKMVHKQNSRTTLASVFALPKQDMPPLSTVLSAPNEASAATSTPKANPVKYECSCDLPTVDTCCPQPFFSLDIFTTMCCLTTENNTCIPVAIDIQIPQHHCPCSLINLGEEHNINLNESRAGVTKSSSINLDECGAGEARSPGPSSHQIKMKSIEEEKMQLNGMPKRVANVGEQQILPKSKSENSSWAEHHGTRCIGSNKYSMASCSKASTNELNNNPSKDNKRDGTQSAKALNAATSKVLKEGATQAVNKSNNSDISSISTSSSFTSNDIKITDSKCEVVFEVPNQKLGDIIATDSSSSNTCTHSRDSSSNEQNSQSASSNNSGNSSHDSSEGYYTPDLDSYFKDVVEMQKSFRFLT